MKSFFNKLLGKGGTSSAPIDLRWLDELDGIDDISAIELSTRKLKSYFVDGAASEVERLRALLAIDQENRYRLTKAIRQYTNLQNMRPELENRLLEILYYYQRQVFVGYRNLTKQFFASDEDIIFTYNHLPLVIGRALHAAYAMARYRYYRQQSIADMAWSEIFELFSLLERESLLELTIPLYRGEADYHLGAAFAQACMLDNLSQSGLPKQQVYKISMLLEKWLPWVRISKHYDAQKHLYYVDLSKDHGARRIRLFEPSASCRYWDTEQLSAKIEAAIEALDQDLPHNLEDIGDSVELLEILTLLRAEWSRTAYKRQRRAEDRQKVVKSARIAYGLDDICTHIKNMAHSRIKDAIDASSLDDRLRRHTVIKTAPNVLFGSLTQERWMISDESNSGYGVIVSDALNPAVKLGKLVGMIVEGRPQQLTIGNIRSIKKLASGQHHIGIKIIARQGQWVQLSHTKPRIQKQGADFGLTNGGWQTNTTDLLGFPGIYLPIEPGLSNWPSLLLPRAEFTENSAYQLTNQDKKTILHLEAAIDSKDDWVRVNYPE